MMKGIRPLWAEVNLDNLVYNVNRIKEIIKPPAQLMGIVKADAYGHGALAISRVLMEQGVGRLGVAILEEAVELRKGGIDIPILIMGYTPPEQFDKLLEFDIMPALYTWEDAQRLSALAEKEGKQARVHIKLDTGMGRIGMIPGEESLDVVSNIHRLPGIIIEGIFTHFSVADEKDKAYTEMQYKIFTEFIDALGQRGMDIPLCHAGNSAACIDLPGMHLNMVRPGIILYGIYPSDGVNKERISLKPVMTLKAKISHIKTVATGSTLGYGRKYTAAGESVIATLPVGYADGYTRLLSGKASVLVHGVKAPLAGNICMDQCMADVTGIDGVEAGDEVVLIGQQGGQDVTADELGRLIGTIGYEIICTISKRVPRVYVKEGRIQSIKLGVGR